MEFFYIVISGLTCSLFTFFLMRGPTLNLQDLNIAISTIGIPLFSFILALLIVKLGIKLKKIKKEKDIKDLIDYLNTNLKDTNFYIKKWSGKKGWFYIYKKDSNTLFMEVKTPNNISKDEIINFILIKISEVSNNKVLFSDFIKSFSYEELSFAYIKTRLEYDNWVEDTKLDLISLKPILDKLQSVKPNQNTEDICLLDYYSNLKDIYPYINLDNPNDFYIQFVNSNYKDNILENLCFLLEKLIVKQNQNNTNIN